MTWEEFVRHAAQKLESAGIADGRANAEYLAAHACGLRDRSEWRSKRHEKIRYEHAIAFGDLLLRRQSREPLQYILGEWEFYGLPMIVRPGVLIPRPETEILVEEALKEASLMPGEITIVDAGTGSGAIALALASKLPASQVFGYDHSLPAVLIAKENRARLGLSNVYFGSGDMLEPGWLGTTFHGKVDLFISNPPYVSRDDFETLEPELRTYEPREALTDEGNGYTFYIRLAEHACDLLTPSGRLLVELGFGMGDRVAKIVRMAGLDVLRIVPDLAGIPRVLVARRISE
jgi:release factor glutamine methyltransferase